MKMQECIAKFLQNLYFKGVENMDYSLCPSKEQKRTWIKNYLRSYLEREPCDDEIIQLLDGIDIFEAV